MTIHDLQYLTYPEYLTPVKRRYLRTAIPRSIRRATVIATPSEYVKSVVVEHFGIDPAMIVVVPHGVEPHLGCDAPSESDLRRDYGLGTGPVLVFPAITHPHKGHRFLLDVMARTWTDPDLRLVLLGGSGAVAADVDRAIVELGLGPRIIRPGRVPAADRDGLIALAEALVFPSEYEGFGAPVVEAMALGTPVVCSDQAALAEVVGDAGIVLPRDRRRLGRRVGPGRPPTPRPGRRGPSTRRRLHHRPVGRRARRGLPRCTRARPMSTEARPRTNRRIVVLCPHFDPDTAPTGVVMSPDRARARRARRRGARRHVAALVPHPRDRSRLDGAPRAS